MHTPKIFVECGSYKILFAPQTLYSGVGVKKPPVTCSQSVGQWQSWYWEGQNLLLGGLIPLKAIFYSKIGPVVSVHTFYEIKFFLSLRMLQSALSSLKEYPPPHQNSLS